MARRIYSEWEEYAIRNTQYAIRSTQYAIRNTQDVPHQRNNQNLTTKQTGKPYANVQKPYRRGVG
jgi:hypothetical protein